MRVQIRKRAAFAAIALLLSTLRPASADPAQAAALPKPDRISTVGTMRVEQYGSGSPAMIFIPGLACGSWVWDDAVRRYAGSHTLYVVTLAGFDGLAAPSGPALDGADASLLELITSSKLDRPIVVGHSLGGFLALRFGTEHASLLRGVVSVDGTPVFPSFLQSTPAERAAAADRIAGQMRDATPEQFATGQQATIASMVTDPGDAKRVATLTGKSDPKATAAYASDLFRADLRPDLPKLTVPTLEVAPVPTVAAAYEGPQGATATMADRQIGYQQFYKSLFPGAPNLTVVTIPNSKHFIMVDQPKALFDAITAFVATLS
jgi:pimeloyl-ACP methyl ester carboxylesterase